MNVSLTPELENLVNQKVKSGLYNSASEVIRESLRLLQEQDELKRIRRDELRREIMLGVEQIRRGEYKEYRVDELEQLGEEIIKRGKERREKGKLEQNRKG
ncbi:MAG: type II toxin-antitoxin system ParD family antitoxin [Pyrinomonadaceae bacterium]